MTTVDRRPERFGGYPVDPRPLSIDIGGPVFGAASIDGRDRTRLSDRLIGVDRSKKSRRMHGQISKMGQKMVGPRRHKLDRSASPLGCHYHHKRRAGRRIKGPIDLRSIERIPLTYSTPNYDQDQPNMGPSPSQPEAKQAPSISPRAKPSRVARCPSSEAGAAAPAGRSRLGLGLGQRRPRRRWRTDPPQYADRAW